MKTLKLLLVAALFSLSAVGFSAVKNDKEKQTRQIEGPIAKSQMISFTSAVANPFMKQAMAVHLDMRSVQFDGACGMFIAKLNYNERHYVIYGLYSQWHEFFHTGIMPPVKRSRFHE